MKRTAIITGVTGQDGSYLAELLLEKDYKVYGLKRRSSSNDLGCSKYIKSPDFEVVEGDLMDLPSLFNLCKLARPDEFYNLAAQSHVGTSFTQPIYTAEATGMGALHCLEAVRMSGIHTRFYQASTSELYGGGYGERALNEQVPFHPRSPYGVAKLFAHAATVNYRETYKMFACCGILFNHESPRRGDNFVTQKIVRGIADIKAKEATKIKLGNLDAKRDWGHAEDYVEGMWLMLQHKKPDDFVLATGVTHTVREFCKLAFEKAELGDYQKYVEIDPTLFRPAEVDVLIGDASKAARELGWTPSTSFDVLVWDMVYSATENL